MKPLIIHVALTTVCILAIYIHILLNVNRDPTVSTIAPPHVAMIGEFSRSQSLYHDDRGIIPYPSDKGHVVKSTAWVELLRRQYPKDCKTRNFRVVEWQPVSIIRGLGMEIHHLWTPFMKMFNDDRTLRVIFQRDSLYADAEDCPALDMTCYSAPLTNCTFVNADVSFKRTKGGDISNKRVVYIDEEVDTDDDLVSGKELLSGDLPIHSSFNHWPCGGSFWGMMHVIVWRMRPTQEMWTHIREVEVAMNISHPRIGVHIRRTDKQSEAFHYPIAAYADAFVNMMKVNSWTWAMCLLASDAEDVTETSMDDAIRAAANDVEISWTVVHLDKVRSKTSASTEDQADEIGKTVFGKQVFTTVHTLAQSDGFVGTLSSGLSRIAILLGLGAYHLKTYHSLDRYHGTPGISWVKPSGYGQNYINASACESIEAQHYNMGDTCRGDTDNPMKIGGYENVIYPTNISECYNHDKSGAGSSAMDVAISHSTMSSIATSLSDNEIQAMAQKFTL